MEAWQLSGRVRSGLGQGREFTGLDWVRADCRQRLGIELYPGTLNLHLSSSHVAHWHRIQAGPAVRIPGQNGACDARCYPVQVAGQVPAAVLVPDVAGYPADKVEIVAALSLRSHLQLEDGDSVAVFGQASRRLKAVVFDVDGTLVNSVDAYHIAAGRAAETLGYTVSPEAVRRALNTQQPFWELVVTDPAHRNAETYAELRRQTMRFWPEVLAEHVSLLPGALDTLDRLRAAGVQLGIFTGSRGESFAPLEQAGVLERFDVVLTAADVKRAKPHPEGLLRCLERLEVSADSAAYVGDAPQDVDAGRRAGALAVGMLTGSGDSALLSAAGAHRLAADHTALLEILLPGSGDS